MSENNVYFKCIGSRKELPETLVKQIESSEKITKKNTGLKLFLALNYGGKNDVVESAKNIGQLIYRKKIKPTDSKQY